MCPLLIIDWIIMLIFCRINVEGSYLAISKRNRQIKSYYVLDYRNFPNFLIFLEICVTLVVNNRLRVC